MKHEIRQWTIDNYCDLEYIKYRNISTFIMKLKILYPHSSSYEPGTIEKALPNYIT